MSNRYKIVISKEALEDIKSIKRYILAKFKYRQYTENFLNQIKKSIQKISIFPKAYQKTKYNIEGLDVYLKPAHSYLVFFVVHKKTILILRVLKEIMYWDSVMKEIQNQLTIQEVCDTIERKKKAE